LWKAKAISEQWKDVVPPLTGVEDLFAERGIIVSYETNSTLVSEVQSDTAA